MEWDSASENSGFNGLLGTNGTSYTSGIAFPEEKYYNVYKASSGTTIDELTACNGGYCYGHGLSEVNNWYYDWASFVSSYFPWLARAVDAMDTGDSQLFDGELAIPFYFYGNNGQPRDVAGFRSILVFPQ